MENELRKKFPDTEFEDLLKVIGVMSDYQKSPLSKDKDLVRKAIAEYYGDE